MGIAAGRTKLTSVLASTLSPTFRLTPSLVESDERKSAHVSWRHRRWTASTSSRQCLASCYCCVGIFEPRPLIWSPHQRGCLVCEINPSLPCASDPTTKTEHRDPAPATYIA